MGNILKLHIGDKFGKLTVISDNYVKKRWGKKMRTFWLCRCECGSEKLYHGSRLRSGRTKACGCRVGTNPKSHLVNKKFVNSSYKSKSYASWYGAKRRCYNTSCPEYVDYGGRGIVMCDSWVDSFDNFIWDMGERPEGKTLGRIDNNGNYEPGNCRWEDWYEQSGNRRNTRFVKYKGETIKLIDLCNKLGKDLNVVGVRLAQGWSLRKALNYSSNVYKKRQVTLNSISYPIAKFAKLFGEYEKIVYCRLQSDWGLERTLGEKIPVEILHDRHGSWPMLINIPIPEVLFRNKKKY